MKVSTLIALLAVGLVRSSQPEEEQLPTKDCNCSHLQAPERIIMLPYFPYLSNCVHSNLMGNHKKSEGQNQDKNESQLMLLEETTSQLNQELSAALNTPLWSRLSYHKDSESPESIYSILTEKTSSEPPNLSAIKVLNLLSSTTGNPFSGSSFTKPSLEQLEQNLSQWLEKLPIQQQQLFEQRNLLKNKLPQIDEINAFTTNAAINNLNQRNLEELKNSDISMSSNNSPPEKSALDSTEKSSENNKNLMEEVLMTKNNIANLRKIASTIKNAINRQDEEQLSAENSNKYIDKNVETSGHNLNQANKFSRYIPGEFSQQVNNYENRLSPFSIKNTYQVPREYPYYYQDLQNGGASNTKFNLFRPLVRNTVRETTRGLPIDIQNLYRIKNSEFLEDIKNNVKELKAQFLKFQQGLQKNTEIN